MKKIMLLCFIFVLGFKVTGSDYKEDSASIIRAINDLEVNKQDRDREIYTSAPANADGRVSEFRVVNLTGTHYLYIKVAESTWIRILED